MNRLHLFILLSIFQSIVLRAQDLEEKVPLRQVLVEIELGHSVTFTYADENVDGIAIVPPLETAAIEEVISYLESETGLEFRQISNQIYSIKKPEVKIIDICGVILEHDTEIFIEGATVQSKKSAAVSNKEGNFFIEGILETDTLTFRFLGFEYRFPWWNL